MHGMVLINWGEPGHGRVLATCLCGWFATEEYKVDIASSLWRGHYQAILHGEMG